MKNYKVITAVLIALILGFIGMQCQHKDENFVPVVGPDPIERGTEIITCTDCNTQPASGSGKWYHDKSHSNVMWETQYMTEGSLLTGRFDSFFMTSLNFDEAVPSNLSFEGYVWLNAVNTGEPGRDEGCLLTTFGTSATPSPDNNAPTNKAILKTKASTGKYSSSDAGFLVDADFTFLGKTVPVVVKLNFAPKFGTTTFTAGFSSEFSINKADFLPDDTNIGNVIKIRMNNTMKTR